MARDCQQDTACCINSPHLLDAWRLNAVKFCDGWHMSNTVTLFQLLEPNSFQLQCCLLPDDNVDDCTTVLLMVQRCSHWLICVLGSRRQWWCICYCLLHVHKPSRRWPHIMHMHRDRCHTRQACTLSLAVYAVIIWNIDYWVMRVFADTICFWHASDARGNTVCDNGQGYLAWNVCVQTYFSLFTATIVPSENTYL